MKDKLEIYKLAVEMADRVSARRISANTFFLSINTALLTLIGFTYEKFEGDVGVLLVAISIAGIILSLTWLSSIRSYKRLNRAKFTVINELEKELPFQYFTDEWQSLKQQTSGEPLKGLRQRWLKFKDRYTELTNIETIVPAVMIVVFLLVIAAVMIGLA